MVKQAGEISKTINYKTPGQHQTLPRTLELLAGTSEMWTAQEDPDTTRSTLFQFLSFYPFFSLFSPTSLCRASYSLTISPFTFQVNFWHSFWLVWSNFCWRQEGPGILLIAESFVQKLPSHIRVLPTLRN